MELGRLGLMPGGGIFLQIPFNIYIFFLFRAALAAYGSS